VVRETRQLEQVNESFEQIEKGEIDARLVFDFRH
jgi:D-arabinose 1-dehydrogenase-like Zn-dependent alcohol dehydrogenase